MIGKNILHYKIVEKLGEGGMGIVYLAEDTKLERQVAIKFLPGHITSNSDERKRFEIEAKAAAALNHPNIATIHAIEEVENNIFLVMEYIKGKHLKNHINSKPLSIDEVTETAIQIAEGLQAAHKRGIVHRDIKSANIMSSGDGKIKIMDFGLAKFGGSAQLTQVGTTIGTTAYMSPEQSKGEEVDYRTDIWSFGVVLCEMLTGTLPFKGDYDQAVIYSILNEDVDLSLLSKMNIPEKLTNVIKKSLQKNPDDRFKDLNEVLLILTNKEAAVVKSESKKQNIIYAVLGIAIIGLLLWNIFSNTNENNKPIKDKIITKITSLPGLEDEPTWSPDGNHLAYTADDKGNLDIMVMPIGGGRPIRVVDNKADDSQPAWSPDGSKLAFVSARDRGGHLSIALGMGQVQDFMIGKNGDIFLIPALGGSAVKLVEDGYYPSWSPDGKSIVYQSPRDGKWNLWKIPVAGGANIQLTKNDYFNFHPSWSPDGKWIVYASGDVPFYNLKVIPADGEKPRLLTNSQQRVIRPVWSMDGTSIIYSSDRNGSYNLWKIPFLENDHETLETPHQITLGQGADVNVSLSPSGNELAYSTNLILQDVWELDIKSSDTRRVTFETSEENFPRLAPDGKNLVISSNRSGKIGLWMIDLNGNIIQQLTTSDEIENSGVLSPDGKQIVYTYHVENQDQINQVQILIRPLGSLSPKLVDAVKSGLEFPIWSPDGKLIAYHKDDNGKSNIWIYDVQTEEKWQLTDFETHSAFATWSPDGKFITYHSLLGSVRNIWTIPVKGGSRQQITFGNEEHSHPQWSPVNMDEILYVLNHKNICTVSVSTGEIRQLTNNVESDLILDYPSWSPDGQKVYYSISRKTGDIYTLKNY